MTISGLEKRLRGRGQGKDRPICLVAASDSLTRPRYVVLLPITHTPPDGDTVGIEIPARVRQAIGLDDEPSWVVVSEYNIDEWPNAGLSPLPGKPGTFSYGFIPPGLFKAIKAKFLEAGKARKERCGPPLIQCASQEVMTCPSNDWITGLDRLKRSF